MATKTQHFQHNVAHATKRTLPKDIAQRVTEALEKKYFPGVEQAEELTATEVYKHLAKHGPASVESILDDLNHDEYTYLFVMDILSSLRYHGYVKSFSKTVDNNGISQKLVHFRIRTAA